MKKCLESEEERNKNLIPGLSKNIMKVPVIYMIVGLLWVALSDELFIGIVKDKNLLKDISIAKGFIFVILTTMMIYYLIKRDMKKIELYSGELHKNEEKYRGLFNEMSEGFALREIICDEKGNPVNYRYLDINPSFERLTGLKKEQLLGKTVMEVIPDVEINWIEIYGQVALTGKPARFQRYSKDFEKYLEVIVFCPQRGKFATLMVDVTERVKIEDEIKKLNEGLEIRVKERTAQLEASNKELEAFSYSVSHDLRAPLRAIEGFSSILLEDYGSRLDTEGQRYLNIISKNTVQMGKLIDDLLSFSRMSRNSMSKERINMEELVKAAFDELYLEEAGRDITLDIKTLPRAIGDPSMIKRVIVNLLSNSIKFTRNKEKAVLEVGCLKNENENIYYIKDNGIGFDKKYIDKLFGVFQRLHSADEFEGTGIGLALVQRIIRRHGGRVWAEGRVNEGTTVYFTLERQAYDKQQAPEIS